MSQAEWERRWYYAIGIWLLTAVPWIAGTALVALRVEAQNNIGSDILGGIGLWLVVGGATCAGINILLGLHEERRRRLPPGDGLMAIDVTARDGSVTTNWD